MKMIKQPTIPPMPKRPTFDARDTQYNLPIGTDLISRAAAQTELQLSARRYTVAHEAHGEGRVVWSEDLISVSDAMDVLRKIPSAQPEIIRCKDCKHNPKLSWFGCPMSHLSEAQRPETAWCWKAERREVTDGNHN